MIPSCPSTTHQRQQANFALLFEEFVAYLSLTEDLRGAYASYPAKEQEKAVNTLIS
jgi:hypothetical protein